MAGAEPDATGLVPPAATGVRRVLLLGVWLGLVHLNVGVLVVLFLALRPLYATLALAAWIATGFLPVAETRAADGGWFAAEIVRTAEAYHKMSVVFDDKAALEAAASKAPVVFAYAPHAFLPNCVAAFAYDGPVRRALHHLPTIKDMRVLASSCFMWLPVLHHVWTWMGGAPVSRKKIREHLSAGRSVVLTPGGVAETLLLDRQDEVLFLKKRFGFVRLAAEQGAYIVPVFAFGPLTRRVLVVHPLPAHKNSARGVPFLARRALRVLGLAWHTHSGAEVCDDRGRHAHTHERRGTCYGRQQVPRQRRREAKAGRGRGGDGGALPKVRRGLRAGARSVAHMLSGHFN